MARRKPAARSNAAQARAENRRKQALIAAWGKTGTISGTVPSGTGTTPINTPSEGVLNPGQVGAKGTVNVDVDRTGLVGGVENFLEDLPQYLKIAAGGLGLIVTGLALVYVAGRNTPVGQAASVATNAVPVKRAAKAAGSVASGRKALAGERRERKFYQTAYENTEEAKAGAAEVRKKKVLPRHEGVVKGSGKAYKR